MTKIAVFGAAGRMGRTVIRLAAASPDLAIVGAAEADGSPFLGKDAGDVAGAGHLGVAIGDLGAALLGAEVVIDFSTAAAFDRMVRAAARARVAVVSGTTRLSPENRRLIDKCAEKIAILWAPNMSLGVAVLAELLTRALAALPDYEVELVEAHHGQKTDAPSGTAALLIETAQRVRPGLRAVHGRHGDVGARDKNEIGVHALRGGAVVGDHSVHLLGEFDRIELTHRAMSRDLFAQGALRAARWIVGKPAGVYRLGQVLESGVR